MQRIQHPNDTDQSCDLRKSLDVILTLVLFFPLIVLWWAGTWQLLDIYLFKDSHLYSVYASLAVGSVAGLLGHIAIPFFSVIQNPEIKAISLRIFIYVYSLGYINYWRGIWNLCDEIFKLVPDGYVIVTVSVVFGICVFILLLTRTGSDILSTPFYVGVDFDRKFYRPTLCFGTKVSPTRTNGWHAYIADVVVTYFGIATVSIVTWKTIWIILDNTIYPDDEFRSYLVCLAAGYGMSVVLISCWFPLQWTGKALNRHVHYSTGYVYVEVVRVIAAVCTVILWRGAWQLLDEYALNMVVWRCLVCHFASFAALGIFQASSVLAPLGCSKDVTPNVNHVLKWQIDYLSFTTNIDQEMESMNEGDSDGEQGDPNDTEPLVSDYYY